MEQLQNRIAQVQERVAFYWDDIVRDLGKVVAINSERGEATAEAPFGVEPLRALKTYLEMASESGFATDNVDNYAGIVSLGDGDESIGVLAHLDIVPAGKGWSTDPFTLVERDGKIYGRGTSDNKGAAIGALYGLKIIRDLGFPLKKKIEVIVGTNEEQGSGCMKYFVKHRPIPSMGFTPDADYPLIHGEKGNLWTELHFPAVPSAIRSFYGGEAFNAVPAEAVVLLDWGMIAPERLAGLIQPEDTLGYDATVTTLPDGTVELRVKGLAAHGSTPEKGVNAIVSAATILMRYPGLGTDPILKFIRDEIGRDTRGERIGVAASDEASGPLSLNLGMIRYEKNERTLCIDIRFPVTMKREDMIASYEAMVQRYGLSYKVIQSASPHYVPKDSPIVTRLMDVYRAVSGEHDAEPFIIGGGTYAKEFGGNFVAFGPEFPGAESCNIHNFDEYLVIEDYKKHLVICTLAMASLAER